MSTDNQKTILLIDDDVELLDMLESYLQAENYSTISAENGSSALEALQNNKIDLIVLDVLLGDESGLTLINQIREISPLPVIMMSGRGDAPDRIVGIEAGADDYIAKPFFPKELSTRIQALFRREEMIMERASVHEADEHNEIRFDCWVCARNQYQVFHQETKEPANLTTTEFRILEQLLLAANRTLSRDQLFDTIGVEEPEAFDRAIDVHVTRIRKKLDDTPRNPKYIKTVRGIGYIFVGQVDEQHS